jgi:hypothetical protein
MTTLIVCAGMMRSGSTWTYNAIRFLLEAQLGTRVYGAWVEDYEPGRGGEVHVIKVHEPDDKLAECAHAIITSHRDLRDIAASAWLREWVGSEQQAVEFVGGAVACHEYWLGKKAHDLPYRTIRETPLFALCQVAQWLGCTSNIDYAAIMAKIDALPVPAAGRPDAVSLLHPQHRANGGIGYFKEVLPQKVILRIERTYGEWLRNYGFIA